MLILSRKAGESLIIGDDIEIMITEVSGDKVKIGIQAPQDVKIFRKELLQTMECNREAACGVVENQLRTLMRDLKDKL